MLLTLSNLPVDNFSLFFPIFCPESSCHQEHLLFALASMACTIAPIKHHHFALLGNRDPNAIQLDHFGYLLQRSVMKLMDQRLDLIDSLVNRSQPDRMADRRTPAFTHITQTLTASATPECFLCQIHPKPLIFLEKRIIADHVMLALLTFQHGHLQVLNGTPTCLQITPIMAVSGELIGIIAFTGAAFPVYFLYLALCLPRLAFLSPQFRCDL